MPHQSARKTKVIDRSVESGGMGSAETEPHLQVAKGRHGVDLPAMHAELRARVGERMMKMCSVDATKIVCLIQGGVTKHRYDTDVELIFRQESNFHYLFGVNIPDLFGLLDIDVSTRTTRAILLIPRLDPLTYEIWSGKVRNADYFKEEYGIDDVSYVEQVDALLAKLCGDDKVVHILQGNNSDSKRPIPAPDVKPDGFSYCGDVLLEAVTECRVIKTERELQLLRYVNTISSAAHREVMQFARPGMFEYQLEAKFLHSCYHNGACRQVAYTSICGCGPNSAVLHYGHAGAPNAKKLVENDICLLDMGSEFHCYASDITCSFPASGRFTKLQKEVYTIVYNAQRAVESEAKPGVEWADMHRLAERTIAAGLIKYGFVHGKCGVDQLMELNIPALFMPHGLGHLMGLDVHDVGGYPRGRTRINRPGIRYLRCNRVLEAGMVLTNEPGMYFIPAILEPAMNDHVIGPLLNQKKIREGIKFGGIRLEDDIIITESGCETMTDVPRTVEEIEALMTK